jgi:hypothetical protein
MNIKHIMGVAIIASIFSVLDGYTYQENQRFVAKDHKNAEYVIDGRSVKLEEGISEVISGPGSASKIITRYFGNEVYKDLNDDGREDIVFLLTQETGGSGIFFYVAAALGVNIGGAPCGSAHQGPGTGKRRKFAVQGYVGLCKQPENDPTYI